jgi:hypothetical protein
MPNAYELLIFDPRDIEMVLAQQCACEDSVPTMGVSMKALTGAHGNAQAVMRLKPDVCDQCSMPYALKMMVAQAERVSGVNVGAYLEGRTPDVIETGETEQ